MVQTLFLFCRNISFHTDGNLRMNSSMQSIEFIQASSIQVNLVSFIVIHFTLIDSFEGSYAYQ